MNMYQSSKTEAVRRSAVGCIVWLDGLVINSKQTLEHFIPWIVDVVLTHAFTSCSGNLWPLQALHTEPRDVGRKHVEEGLGKLCSGFWMCFDECKNTRILGLAIFEQHRAEFRALHFAVGVVE